MEACKKAALMKNVLGIKCSKAFPLLVMKIPLLEYFATVSAKVFPLLRCSVAPAKDFALLNEDKDYSQSKMCVSYSWNGCDVALEIFRVDMEACKKAALMKNVLGIKCSKAFPLLVMKIPLLEYFATVSAKVFPLLRCSVAPAKDFALLNEDKDYSQSKMCVSYSWNVSRD
nr:hypothetical protein [Tanacetum cinerariifolium]